jgi:hypothetical protein
MPIFEGAANLLKHASSAAMQLVKIGGFSQTPMMDTDIGHRHCHRFGHR